jgi:SAM-dependent methyltransferase
MRRRRPCPVCGALESKHLLRQSFAQLSRAEFLDGYDVVVCATCGLGFADGIPTQKVFDAYYRDWSKYEHGSRDGRESELDERRFRDIAVTIARFIPSQSSKVLEIGCATGRLLSLLREAGYANIQGLDPSPGCAQAAWDLYAVPVFTGSLFDIPAPASSFDVVIAIGVLEHVEDLRKALEHIRAALTPNGRVYAEVPDASNLAGRPDSPYQEFSTEHINFFSTKSLTNLFRTNGFGALSTGKSVRQQHENTTYPAAFGIYHKSESAASIEPDDVTESGLRQYIRESAAADARVRRAIEDKAGRRTILVWGTGTHTQRLLAAGAFANVHIAAFVDSNPKYQGHELQGTPIIGPLSLYGRREPILISTRGFQPEIQDQIRNQLNLDNELILLYGAD